MRHILSLAVLGMLFFVACNSQEEELALITPTSPSTPTTLPATNTIQPLTTTPTTTPTPTQTITPSPTATATAQPTSTPTLTAAIAFSDPFVTQLEEQGYTNEPIYGFELMPSSGATYFSNMGQFGRLSFGGPDFDDPVSPDSLVTKLPSGKTYSYVQYMTPNNTTCELLFFVSTDTGDQLIGNVNIAELNERISSVVASLQAGPSSPLFCLPYGWQDINNNGRPDMSVTILWANNYTGGEVHIFEVTDDDTIIELTADLPGAVYHYEFSPDISPLLVVNLAWADHDCLYPSSPFGFWIYDWDGEAYRDATANFSYTEYRSYLESLLTPGRPFNPITDIGPLVSLLLNYDYSGQRELGWQRFLELADVQNWPGTDQEALNWLQDDLAHLTDEYEAGLPFTPNDANCGP